MVRALLDAIRDRLTVRNGLSAALLFGFLHFVVGTTPAQLATTMAMSLVVGLADVVEEVYDLRESVKHLATGLPAVIGAVGLLALDDGPRWLPVAFLAIGGWFVLDAVQTARHEGITEQPRSGREVYHDYVGRRIHEVLDEQPRTRRELSDALDADDDAVDAALAKLASRDVVRRVGSEYRLAAPDDRGRLARTRDRLGRLGRRVARPVTIEFEGNGPARDVHADHGDSDAAGVSGSSSTTVEGDTDSRGDVGRSGGTDGSGRAAADDRDRDQDRDRERELESESESASGD